MERDRAELQTQLETLQRQLAESRDRRDVTTAESRQLEQNLSAAEQTLAQMREILRQKVVRRFYFIFCAVLELFKNS